MRNLLAETVGTPTQPPTVDPIGGSGANFSIEALTNNIIGAVLWIIGAVAVLAIIYGGFLYMTAGGDSDKTTKARNVILYAILGVIVVALSFLLVSWATSGSWADWFQ